MKNKIGQKHFVVLAGLVMVFGAIAVTNQFTGSSDDAEVVATFYPFYEIAGQVAGEEVEVESLVLPGTDPHSFEPSPGDIESLNNAEVFIVTGAEFEQWERDIVDSLNSDVEVVDPSEHIELIEFDEDHTHEHGHEDEHNGHEHEEGHHDEHHDEHSHEENGDHGHEDEEHSHEEENSHHGEGQEHEEDHHDHDHGAYDPHYWLSPKNAEIIADEINKALQETDPENSEVYESNTLEFVSELERLDSEFEERLEACEKDTILITHAAFAYLGQDYGFDQVQVTGLGHVTEPTAKEIERLQNEAREHGIEHVFYDSMVDSSVAETIAEGADAELLVLNSIEGAQERPYVEKMEENLENLETALQC